MITEIEFVVINCIPVNMEQSGILPVSLFVDLADKLEKTLKYWFMYNSKTHPYK